jgi:hypothetical protein
MPRLRMKATGVFFILIATAGVLLNVPSSTRRLRGLQEESKRYYVFLLLYKI